MRFLCKCAMVCRAICPLVAAALMLAGCDGLGSKPSARITGAHLGGLSLDGATIRFDVDVANPGKEAMPVSKLDYALSTQGQKFIEGEAPAVDAVPARSRKTIVVPVTLSFAQLLEALDMGEPGSVVPYDADFGMNVTTPPDKEGKTDQRLAMKWEGRFPVPAMPRIESSEIEWTDTGMLSTKGLIKMNVTNVNKFDVTLKKMEYRVRLQGATLASGGIPRSLSFGPGQQRAIEIPVKLSALKVGAAILDATRKREAGFGVTADLEIGTEFGDISLPYDSAKRPGTR
ncbi:MAG: LEA type 2 family protein [Planctomycetes bacterium]|nr:LEA type 2 family protein [Planctomycetota bacterium]